MKRYSQILLLSFGTLLLTSCDLVQGIFNAGMWTGFVIVGVVIALIIWILVKVLGRK